MTSLCVEPPVIGAMRSHFGDRFQKLDQAELLNLIQALAYAAAAAYQDGISERLDMVMLDLYPDTGADLLSYLQVLDGQLDGHRAAVAFLAELAAASLHPKRKA